MATELKHQFRRGDRITVQFTDEGAVTYERKGFVTAVTHDEVDVTFDPIAGARDYHEDWYTFELVEQTWYDANWHWDPVFLMLG